MNLVRQISIYLFIFFVLSGQSFAREEQKHINITTIDYPPLMGHKSGLMTDIVEAAFLARSLNVSYKIYPMARIIWSVTDGDSDATIGSIRWFKSGKRARDVLHDQIYQTNMHFFYKKDRFVGGLVYGALEELQKYDIGYITGGSLTSILKNAGIDVQYVDDLEKNAKKLNLDRIDMFGATELGGWTVLEKLYPESLDQFTISDKPVLSISGDIIFPKSKPEIQREFQKGFQEIQENGTYLQLLRKYYGRGKIPENLLAIGK